MRDPLGLAALLAIVVVGVIAAVDLAANHTIDPGILALTVGVIAPIVPALLARQQPGRRSNGNGKARHDEGE